MIRNIKLWNLQNKNFSETQKEIGINPKYPLWKNRTKEIIIMITKIWKLFLNNYKDKSRIKKLQKLEILPTRQTIKGLLSKWDNQKRKWEMAPSLDNKRRKSHIIRKVWIIELQSSKKDKNRIHNNSIY